MWHLYHNVALPYKTLRVFLYYCNEKKNLPVRSVKSFTLNGFLYQGLRHNGYGKMWRNMVKLSKYGSSFYAVPITLIFNGQRASGKRANSFWQLSPWHQLELLVCLLCWQTGKEFRLHWHSFVRVQIYYEYWLSINRTNTRSNNKSFLAQWLAHWPPDSGIVRSSPAINIFRRIKLLLFFYFLVFPFYFSQFWSKQCANIYWKNDNAGFAMDKKPNFFNFSG